MSRQEKFSIMEINISNGDIINIDYNNQPDWNETSSTNMSYIKNKPTKLSQFENDINIPSQEALQELQNQINSEVERAGLAESALTTDLSSHVINKYNPHSVTKSQVGLGNVDNTSDLSKPISTTTQNALDLKANNIDLDTTNSNLSTHISNKYNPHSVTKSQVELGNVDNTSDLNKPISTATQSALDLKADLVNGLVPANQLPSYGGDVLEFDSIALFPTTGLPNKIYIAKDTNTTYRWGGTEYIGISSSGSSLTLGDTDSNAYYGGKGKTAYDHSQTTGNPHSTQISDISGLSDNLNSKATNDDLQSEVERAGLAESTLSTNLTSHTENNSNPHSVTKSQVGLSNVDNTSDLNKPISTATQSALNTKASTTDLDTTNSNLSTHTTNTSNPHSVTKAQVGLSNVDNTSDLNKPVSTATQTVLNTKASTTDLTSHTTNTSNPHSVTKAQVGLGNVDNTSDLSKPISTATQSALDLKASTTDLTSHTTNTSNPHSVTKAQVGLSNVDNTSDLNKPISTATQSALDLKVDKTITVNGQSLASNVLLSLNDLSDVSVDTPTIDTYLGWNGADFSLRPIASVSAGNGIQLFFTNVDSDITDYYVLSNSPDTSAEVILSTTVNNTKSLLKSFATDSINKTSIDPGIYIASIYGYADTPGSSQITIEVYLRTSAGAETLIISTQTFDLLNEVSLQDIKYTGSVIPCNLTDRIVVKVSAQTTNTSDTIVYFYFGDSNHYSYINTPFTLSHNDLPGLQGGTSGEYYHLTQTQLTNFGTAYTHSQTTGNPHNTTISDISGLSTSLDSKASTTDLTSHTTNTSNPHSVTKAQVGLGNVDNTSDLNKPVSTATQSALDLKASTTDLTSHTTNTSNPHSVTKSQVGLGNVLNYDTTTTANITDSTNKRFVTDSNLTLLNNTSGTNTGDENITSISSIINSASSKNTPVDTDTISILDSADSNTFKKLSWANNKATLKSYFDSIYTLSNLGGISNITGLISAGLGIAITGNGTVGSPYSISSQGNSYPSAGIVVSTGSAWSTSLTAPSGTIVGTTDSQTLTNKTITSPTFNTSTTYNYSTTSTVPYFNASKQLISSSVTSTELGYLSGVSSAVQTQLNSKYSSTNFIAGTDYIAPTGSGSGLTNLSASNITSGTLAKERLSTSGVSAGSYTNSSITVDVYGRVTSVSSGDLSLYVLNSRTINSKALSSDIVLTTADISDSTDKRFVTDSESVILSNTSGTNTGDETNATIITKLGFTPLSNTDTTVTKQGNTFNGASQLVQTTTAGKLPALDASLLTNLPSSTPTDTIITLGTVSSGTVTLTADKMHSLTVGGALTIALPTGLTSGVHYNCSVLITMSSAYTVTLPTTTWANNAAPTMTSTTAKYRLTFETINGGSTWYGYSTVLGA